jgi:hypothetical protein
MSLQVINALFRFKITNYEENVEPALEDFFNELEPNIQSMDCNYIQDLQDRIIGNNKVLKENRTPFVALVIHLKFQHYLGCTYENFMAAHDEYRSLGEDERHSLHEFYNYMKCALHLYCHEAKVKTLIMRAVSHLSSGPLNGRVYATGGKATIHAKHRIAIYEKLGGKAAVPLPNKRQCKKRPREHDLEWVYSGSPSSSSSPTPKEKTLRNEKSKRNCSHICTCMRCGRVMKPFTFTAPVVELNTESGNLAAGPIHVPTSAAAAVPVTNEDMDFVLQLLINAE